MDIRVGFGYDVHRLAPGRPLVLGGVAIPFALGLEGHSDADVLTHAVMDALLGAASLEDIGHHFPPSDEQYRGVSSLRLLGEVRRLVENAGWEVVNVDSTIVAERPRVAPYLVAMKMAIGENLGLDASRLGIKATTNEGLGALGREEGIAAMAVALLSRREVQFLEE